MLLKAGKILHVLNGKVEAGKILHVLNGKGKAGKILHVLNGKGKGKVLHVLNGKGGLRSLRLTDLDVSLLIQQTHAWPVGWRSATGSDNKQVELSTISSKR